MMFPPGGAVRCGDSPYHAMQLSAPCLWEEASPDFSARMFLLSLFLFVSVCVFGLLPPGGAVRRGDRAYVICICINMCIYIERER